MSKDHQQPRDNMATRTRTMLLYAMHSPMFVRYLSRDIIHFDKPYGLHIYSPTVKYAKGVPLYSGFCFR